MDLTLLSGHISLAQDKTQSQFSSTVKRLSSGLRISSAIDDPSGLAISEKQQTLVNGLDAGSQSIQDANNALNVADGALQTVGAILQRLRTLVVEANSTLLSSDDQKNVQTEIDALSQEVDSITQRTQFNGQQLLDGSLSSQPPLPQQIFVPQNDGLSGGGTLIRTDAGFDPQVAQPSQVIEQSLTVDSYDSSTGLVTVSINIESPDGTFGGLQTQQYQFQNGADVPYDPIFPNPEPTAGNPTFNQASQQGLGAQVISFNTGAISSTDVGKSSLIFTIPAQTKAPGGSVQVNSGSAEGTVVNVDIPAVNSTNLAVNQIVLGDTLANQANEYRVDYAINLLANVRSQVGAQTVALQDTVTNNGTEGVATTASVSAIRDANIGAETTQYTKDQILVTIQSSLLTSVHQLSASDTLALVNGSGTGTASATGGH